MSGWTVSLQGQITNLKVASKLILINKYAMRHTQSNQLRFINHFRYSICENVVVFRFFWLIFSFGLQTSIHIKNCAFIPYHYEMLLFWLHSTKLIFLIVCQKCTKLHAITWMCQQRKIEYFVQTQICRYPGSASLCSRLTQQYAMLYLVDPYGF